MFVGPLPEFALTAAQKLVDSGLFREIPDQLIVNEYQPGQGIAAHIDCLACFQDVIATISLGSVYTVDLTDTASESAQEIDL